MRLAHLNFQNYARLADFDLEVREHLVAIGANDVGKTSLLRGLNFLLGASVQQLFQGLGVSDLRDPNTALVVRGTLDSFTDNERALFPDEISIAADGVTESLTIELVVEVDADDPEQVAIRRYFPNGGGRSPSREQLDSIAWQYLPANRSSAPEFMDGKRSPLKTMLATVNLGADRDQLAATLGEFNAKLESNQALADLRASLAEHMSRSMPRAVEPGQLILRTTTDPQTDVLDEVTLFLRSGDAVKALAEQSDGIRQLMTMTFFDLAQSAANMVAIDEPELHLHASSQRTVADMFAHGTSQRLLVTHSPYIVQRFEPEHVVVVTASGDLRQIPEANFSDVEKVHANWWSPQLLEALTARHVLLVEGAADRIFVEACARVRGVNLDRMGVTVLELGGAEKFKHVNKLLGKAGFDMDVIGLVDAAESGSWIGGLSAKPADVNKRIVFVCDADLEDEYSQAMTGPLLGSALVEERVCNEIGLLQAASVSNLADLGHVEVAKFCRDGRKVTSAVAAGKHVTEPQIQAMPAISGLIAFLESL